MKTFSSLRMRLVGTVFFAIAPAWVLMYFIELPWMGFVIGLLALAAAWFGGERFILRQVRTLYHAAKQLAAGDLSSRAGFQDDKSELGQLARTFDQMAESLEQRAQEREEAERTLMNRALQQTVVAALGQFALVGSDLNALLNQAVMLVSQTMNVEFCRIMELQPDRGTLLLRAGVGWKRGCVGEAIVPADGSSQSGLTLVTGEPVVVADLSKETRFKASALLRGHGIVSGVTVLIAPRQRPYGVLGVHTSKPRQFADDQVQFLLSVATSLALAVERTWAEADLLKLALFAQLNPNPAMELAEDGSLTYFNDAALRLALSVGETHPRAFLPPTVAELVKGCLASNHGAARLESRFQQRTLSWSFHPVPASRVVHAYLEDITDRLNLENQLRQSQKMESVGQLAAGVAHDFNNMLTIIQGHAGILMAKPNLPPDLFDSAQAVYFAAERAAGLTRQLLMFSRKNVMQARLLDLADTVGNMSRMLQRLLGETIQLEFTTSPTLPYVEADAGMIEQVVMNLSVNARDAMPKSGTLAINVEPVQVTADYVELHPEARAGSFVCLRITDNGEGIDPANMARIFEPFFTTKEVGKGTGLGLATVYGIVKQHGGWIEVTSEVGVGTSFRVFFPASDRTPAPTEEDSSPTAFVSGGKETILVVEDEIVLRDMARLILTECGYTILEAANGREALEVWRKHKDRISLLLTDMVMPEGVSGVELADQLLADNPRLRVTFTSGYTMEEVNDEFLARKNAQFLQKPYTRVTLAKAVRQALDIQPTPSAV